MNVMWFSAGVSSAAVLLMCRQEIDVAIYQHIDDQHPDTLRFLRDVELAYGKPIIVRQSPYKSVEAVCRAFGVVNNPRFAECTRVLKRRERKEWENENPGRHTYFWGMDADETKREAGIRRSMTDYDHRFPLIERNLSKQDAHGMLARMGIKRPVMYDMGYANNNCIGCVKAGMGWWNKVRVDFPEVFASRAKMERDIGHSCITGIYLDELDPQAGRHDPPITTECGIFCYLNSGEQP
jgi:hypothetical protein